jgi:hypothetical protein
MGGGQNSLKNLRASPFSKDLSNETIFSPIHLAGQYLQAETQQIALPKNARNPYEGCFGHTT